MRTFLTAGAALCVACLLFAAGLQIAHADDRVAAPAPSFLIEVWTIVQPLAALFVSIVGPVFVTWIAGQIIKRLNISNEGAKKAVEAQVRDALHKAALNGLKFAVAKAGLPATVLAGTIPQPILADAIEYVRTKSPQTIKDAGVSLTGVGEIVLSKVPDVLAALPIVSLSPAMPGKLQGA